MRPASTAIKHVYYIKPIAEILLPITIIQKYETHTHIFLISKRHVRILL